MAIRLSLPFNKTFSVAKTLDSVYAYLWNVEKSVTENFPGLEKLEKIAPETFRWQFKELDYAGQKIGIRLVTRFEGVAPNKIKIHSIPTPHAGNLSGEWSFQKKGEGTEVHFAVKLEIELNIPFFLKAVAGPVAQKELSKIFDRYLNNVEKHLAT